MPRSATRPKLDLCAGHAPDAPADFTCPGRCDADLPEICAAIGARKRVRFLYDGEFRVVEPHYYGVTPKGEQVLHAYQISSGGLTLDRGWYTFKIDGMSGFMETTNEFSRPRRFYDADGRGTKGHFSKL